jgi:lipopolysaccharide biosynthesis glycosyltransferase
MRHSSVTIVTVTDNHYVILLASLIKSIEANLSKDCIADIWVVDDGITEDNVAKLSQSVDTEITCLHWVKATAIIPKTVKLPADYSSWPLAIYMRLFIANFLPKDVQRVIVTDVDMINCRDLADLYNTDLNGYILGAVQDPRVKTLDCDWGGIKNYKKLGLDGSAKYFNSGLMLVDLERWKAFDVGVKTLHCIANNKKYAGFPDQYGLNVVTAGRWMELPYAWNHFACFDEGTPYQLHFVDRKPIYQSYSYNKAYKDLFFKYLMQTKWKDFTPIGEPQRMAKKANNVLEKIFLMFSRQKN